MIKLIDNYEIHGNPYDYSLVINTGRVSVKTDKKTGETTESRVYKTIGYYNNVKSCILACYKDLCRKVVAEDVLTLTEALNRFDEIQKRLEEIIPNCFD